MQRLASLAPALRSIPAVQVRFMAGEGVRGFSEHEKTIEDLYFTQEDKKLLGKLLNKVKAQTDEVDKNAAEGAKHLETTALKAIVAKYNVSSDDIERLYKWKHTHY